MLIPYACWESCATPQDGEAAHEKGFIVLLSPEDYFGNASITADLAAKGLVIGNNALVFYETREDWDANNPESLRWEPARSRTNPLGGHYVARISATTATDNGGRIVRGFDATAKKGAGIRVYEYASTATTAKCRLQLEALFWLCSDSHAVAIANGMTPTDAVARKSAILAQCTELGLLDEAQLTEARILNAGGKKSAPCASKSCPANRVFRHPIEVMLVFGKRGVPVNIALLRGVVRRICENQRHGVRREPTEQR